ncbi:MAG: amidohydrolase [Gemmatimonadales bacterium]|nr:MAG: amidohydrolase [Gemmatimonadales bacterium]
MPILAALTLAAAPVQAQDAAGDTATRAGANAASWDVNAPPYALRSIDVDVSEGTWISLDVSPDGTEIVFDLLGDLYTIPMEGGDARPLTSEFAWNMQPRYSPDGRWIAFVSDRAGGDNLWIMDRSGENLRQVTRESFRLLSGPAWSPDSDYLVGRKHFTGTRSLGAGEMWMYHRTGGGGVQLTERPNDQQDVNEPAFSPDGRFLYFSQDMTPGPTFEYNKDPNRGIYAVRRLDLESGQLQNFTGGPGGAARPTPSPDGRYLAFVRRVRYDTQLFLRDLETGREWPVAEGLDRDMQEIWAIHGVYPAMAWTPDSGSLVFWSGGKIHRLHVESGERAEIPFRVRTTRQVADAVRFPVEVHPDSFDVKMLRWVEVAPGGDRVAYSAMGHLWVRNLPDGTPRRVTSQQDHFEFYPSWSRDGQRLAYVSWNDDDLGAVRVVDVPRGAGAAGAGAGGGTAQGRVVTPEPGHYLEPVFTPDGREIVYRRVGGGGLVSPDGTPDDPRGTGLFRIPVTGVEAGGEPFRIGGGGSTPHFGADADRVYFSGSDGGRGALQSIGLDGQELRTHLRSQWATTWRVAPDGRHVAWIERFQAYVRPFVQAARTVDVSATARDLPQARVSRDAGDWLHFAEGGSTLHWALGPELFSVELEDVFTHLREGNGDAESGDAVDLPVAAGTSIGPRAASAVPSGTVAFTGARIITMQGDQVIENGTLVVEGNRITAVGEAGQVQVPAGAHVVDAAGRTIMPGIVDVHWHGGQGRLGIIPQRNRMHYVSLAFGVTTIHDPSTNSHEFFTAAEMARGGMVTGPRLFATGQILYGATTAFTAEVNSLADARQHLRRLGSMGAISVKSYNQPRRDQRQQIMQAAIEEGIMVVPEGGATFMHNLTMVADGHTGIEHSLPVENVYDDVIQYWSQTEVGLTPTLVVAYGGLWGEEYWYSKTNVWENERLLQFSPPLQIEARSRRRMQVPDEEWNHIRISAHTNRLFQAGVPVQLGAHGQQQGLDAHWELWNFGLGGMPNHDALRVATIQGARYLGMDGDLGSLEVGKLADLIVLDANPLEDLRNSEQVRYTMVNGRLFDAATMNEIGNHPGERGRFWWEDWGWR